MTNLIKKTQQRLKSYQKAFDIVANQENVSEPALSLIRLHSTDIDNLLKEWQAKEDEADGDQMFKDDMRYEADFERDCERRELEEISVERDHYGQEEFL